MCSQTGQFFFAYVNWLLRVLIGPMHRLSLTPLPGGAMQSAVPAAAAVPIAESAATPVSENDADEETDKEEAEEELPTAPEFAAAMTNGNAADLVMDAVSGDATHAGDPASAGLTPIPYVLARINKACTNLTVH